MAETCRCGRQRSTPEDLARWKAFEREHPIGGVAIEPEWARALCWSNRPLTECNMKPLAKEIDHG